MLKKLNNGLTKVRGVGNTNSVTECIETMKHWSDVLGDNNVSYIQSHDIACAYDILDMTHEDIAKLVFSNNGHKLIYNGQETGLINTVVNSNEPETLNRINYFVDHGMLLNEATLLANKLSRDNSRVRFNWDNNVKLTELYKKLIKATK